MSPDRLQPPSGNVAPLLQAADRCVKCGLCLPHCPTYGLTGSEAESPRGRITLLQSLAQGQIDADDSAQQAIDHCLSCRACERVCPADVAYGEIFDRGQEMLAEMVPQRLAPVRRRGWLLLRPHLRRALLRLLWLAQQFRLTNVMQAILPRNRALRSLPTLPWPRALRPTGAASVVPVAGKVALFTGCTGDSADQTSAVWMQRLLAAAGYHVEVPSQQTCCGALAQHGGDRATAMQALHENSEAFGTGSASVVALASGCGAWLDDARRLHGDALPWLHRLASPWSLMLSESASAPAFSASAQTVAVWVACTQRNVTRDDAAMLEILGRVPGTQLLRVTSPQGCCGAAGMHFLDMPERADALAAPVIEQLRAAPPDVLLCANVGCRLHLAALLRQAGLEKLPVVHPAEWLAGLLPATGVTRD